MCHLRECIKKRSQRECIKGPHKKSAGPSPSPANRHRDAFITECRQKHGSLPCGVDRKQLNDVIARYEKLKADDDGLAAEIKASETALDSHTVDKRNKRKELQERRNALARGMKDFGKHVLEGQKAMQNLYASVESSLALAKHAEEWSWKESKSSKT